MDLTTLTIAQAHRGLLKKDFSALELTKAFLDKIGKVDENIFSYLTLTKNLAFSQAKVVDDQILQGRKIPLLAGIPLAIKDNILVKGVRCTAGSKILENYIAPYDATVVKKIRSQGAVILGKTNLDEFAMGSSCENSAFFPTKNPYDLRRVPGGSSGGSAAAVASSLAIGALGSDTGGSIRLPASFCGVVGLKPTYGAVSRYGLVAMASSLDQIGPITRTVEDARIIFEAIFGKDPLDSTSIVTKPYYKKSKVKVSEVKIGIPREYFVSGIEKEVEIKIKEVIKKFEKAGAKVEEISLPHTRYALAVYYIIMPAEASANLARYDGIKYGHLSKKAANLLDVYLKSRQEGLGREVKRRIILGTYVLSSGYYEAYYLRAQKVRTLIKEDFDKAFKKVDVILTPVSPTLPFKIGEKIVNPLTMYLSDIFTTSTNLAGLPAISIPCLPTAPKTGSKNNLKTENLPVGFQLIGKSFEEDKILTIGQIYEQFNFSS